MENNIKNTFEKIKEIRMTAAEKSVLSTTVMRFVDDNPVQIPSPISKISFNQPSPYASRFNLFTMGRSLAFVLIGMIIGGGSLSYAAAGSLPGDFLYPTKINFSEEVALALKPTAEAKIEYEQARVETRLAEAGHLMTVGKMDEEKQAQVEQTIDAHLAKINAHLGRLPEEKRRAVAQAVQTRLVSRIENERMLVRNQPQAEPTSVITETAVEPVKTDTAVVVTPGTPVSEIITAPVTVTPGATTVTTDSEVSLKLIAERNIPIAEAKFNEITRLSLSIKNDELRVKLRVRLQGIKQTIADAKAEYSTQQYNDAAILIKKAIILSDQTKTQIEAAIKAEGTAGSEVQAD